MNDQLTRQAELTRMKRVATGVLAGATVLFIITSLLTKYVWWLDFVRAFAEASMIGGIADWFAVTALFRHPLNLPIPHTAIIPRRKDRIAESFGRFVQNNFLSEDVIGEKIRSLDVTRRAAQWLSQPEHGALVAQVVAIGLRAVIEVVKDEDFQDVIEEGVVARLQATEVAPLLGKGLALITAGTRQRDLLAGTLQIAEHLIAQNKDAIRAKIKQETPWWTFGVIDDRIYQKISGTLETTLKEVEADPDHVLHHKFSEILNRFVTELQQDPAVIARGEELKAELLRDPIVRDLAASLWSDIKSVLLQIGAASPSAVPSPIERSITNVGAALLRNELLLTKIDGWVMSSARYLIREYGHEVGHLITQTIRRWDPESTSRRIELQVGRDLQYIRINGAIVGGLAGLVIHIVSLLL